MYNSLKIINHPFERDFNFFSLVEKSSLRGAGNTVIALYIYKNIAWKEGGGVYIQLFNGSGSIELSNCTIYNNTAWDGGGGVYINFHNGSGSTKFSNCTIFSNSALNERGGVYFELRNGSGSIEFSQ